MELNELSQYVYERDRHEFSLGDTLDIKTGLLLASLTFLAIQSGSIISATPLPRAQLVAQSIAIILMVVCGLCCAIELWPRDYMREAMPDEYAIWISSLEDYRKEHPGADAIPSLSSVRLARHWAAVILWFAYYNFCRIHKSLRVTPAMEAGHHGPVPDVLRGKSGVPALRVLARRAGDTSMAG